MTTGNEINYTYDSVGIVIYGWFKCDICNKVYSWCNSGEEVVSPELVLARSLRGDIIQYTRRKCNECRDTKKSWFEKLVWKIFG